MKMIVFVILWVKVILWVIRIIVIFCVVRLWIIVRILFIKVGFSVEVVLLNSIILGCIVRVWVMVMCCFCLLDRFFGLVFVWLCSLIWFSRVSVFLCILVVGCFRMCIGLVIILFSMFICGNRLKF